MIREGRFCIHALIISIIHGITQEININVCIAVCFVLKICKLAFGMNFFYSEFFIAFSNEQLLKPRYAVA